MSAKTIIVIFGVITAAILSAGTYNIISTKFCSSTGSNPFLKNAECADILDRNGKILATGPFCKREYPLGSSAAHLTGYVSREHGLSGLEKKMFPYLVKAGGKDLFQRIWFSVFGGMPRKGEDVKLTIDSELQSFVYGLLGRRKGAIVVMKPDGEIFAMASNPGFDPNSVDPDWKSLENNPEAPFFNRAVQGLYPAASTQKIITSALLIMKDRNINQPYLCEGFTVLNGRKYTCEHAHGLINGIEDAFAFSCNCWFILHANGSVSPAEYLNFYRRWKPSGVSRDLTMSLKKPVEIFGAGELGAMSVGQYGILISPLENCLVAATICNRGLRPSPFLVKAIGKKEENPLRYERIITAEVASQVAGLMRSSVQNGTSRPAEVKGRENIDVFGKTGTMDVNNSRVCWWVGFATNNNKGIVISILIENGESGSASCAPLAARIISFCSDRNEIN